MLQALAAVRMKEADTLPSIDLQLSLQRQRYSTLQAFGPQGVTLGTIGITFSTFYELDLWGRLAAAKGAEVAKLLEAEHVRQQIINTVVTEVVKTYLQWKALNRRLSILSERIKNAQETLDLVKARYQRGLVSLLQVRQAGEEVLSLKALEPALRRDASEVTQRLSVLLGRYPDLLEEGGSPWKGLLIMDPVPPGLPSELLKRRPDIRAAEARMEGMFSEWKKAKAALFPRITLTGESGWSSSVLKGLLQPESQLWRLAAGVMEPFFDAGRLKAEEELAQSRYREAVVDYAKTVLNAFYEVENALLSRRLLLERRELLIRSLKEVEEEVRVARDRYNRGLIDLLTLLRAEQRRYEMQDRLVQTELQIMLTRVNLYMALGGGWEDQDEG